MRSTPIVAATASNWVGERAPREGAVRLARAVADCVRKDSSRGWQAARAAVELRRHLPLKGRALH